MKIAVKIYLVVFLLIGCNSETTKHNSPEKEIESIEEEEDFGESECVPNENFVSGETGLFEMQAVIQIVSFENTTYSESPCEIINGEFKTINKIESITLNEVQKKKLETIIYSTRTKRFGNISEAQSCYVPRHAIVYSGSNETFAFEEICFECNGQRHGGATIGHIDFCKSKWGELKDFFKSVGITYFGPNKK